MEDAGRVEECSSYYVITTVKVLDSVTRIAAVHIAPVGYTLSTYYRTFDRGIGAPFIEILKMRLDRSFITIKVQDP